MNNDLSKNQEELKRKIDEILFYVWDPIGINDIPQARDEYCSYIYPTYKLALEDNCVEKIAEYLNNMQTKMMGRCSNLCRCKDVAEYIYEWCERLEMSLEDIKM